MKTVSFYGECAARSVLTLVSNPITHPFRTKKMRVKFADGCVNEVQIEIMVSPDNEAPATGRPNGSSLLQDYGQVRYLVGNDEVVEIEHDVEVPEGNWFVKVFADNGDFNPHDILVQVTIESVERR